MNSNEPSSKIRKAAKWTMIGSVGTEFANFIFGLALARILIPADFGLIATVGVITGIAGYFSGAGTGQALVRAREISNNHVNVVFTMQIITGATVFILLAITCPVIANFFGDSRYQGLLLVSALNFLVRPLANIPQALLQRELDFQPIIIIDLAVLFVVNILAIFFAWRGFGPWSLVLSGFSGSLFRAMLFRLHKPRKLELKWDREIASGMGRYGIKLMTNNIIEHFRNQTITIVLSRINGPSDVGLYNRASSLAGMPMQIIGRSPYQAVFRSLSTNRENADKSHYIYYKTLKLVALYTLPLYVITWWLAEPGIRFLYGETWALAAAPLQILTVAGLFRCMANVSGAVVEARDKMSTELVFNILAWCILAGALVVGLHYGLIGVALASTITSVFFGLCLTFVAVETLGARWSSVIQSLAPAVLLNLLLFVILATVDSMISSAFYTDNPGIYAFSLGACGVVFYAAAFLFLPIPSLRGEATMWRTKILGLLKRENNKMKR